MEEKMAIFANSNHSNIFEGVAGDRDKVSAVAEFDALLEMSNKGTGTDDAKSKKKKGSES